MSNEGKACDAIIRILEKRTGQMRANVRRSENTKDLPPVEVDFRLGDAHFAVEHTKLETFANQTRSAAQFWQLVEEIVRSLSGHLPKPGTYKLYFPTEAIVGRSMGLGKARVLIREWVLAKAAELHTQHPERRGRNWEPRGHEASISGVPVGLSFELTLWRQVHWSLDARFDGVLTLGRFGPKDLDAQRIVQMVRALDRKCPKLQRFKQAGARTVLVLEDADLSSSNHVTVSDAFEAACDGRTDLPDEVYQISTVTSQWTIWPLKQDDRIELGEMGTDFAADALDDVTG
jgi:hypothetical protein